ncbi:MAG: hypothetical protein V4609_02545 [Pseudomonadota bacterium]
MSLMKLFGCRQGGLFAAVLASAALVACGGGGGSSDEAIGYYAPKVGAQAHLSGAIFTSEVGCTTTNANQYASKDAVYLSGGPVQEGSAGLTPDTDFWVKVTDPSGAVLLGSSTGASVRSDANGELPCLQLSAILTTPGGAPGYDDSPNGGGVYKVWVSSSSSYNGGMTRTDNFRIGAPSASTPAAALTVRKWYDTNANGTWDIDEAAMEGSDPNTGWKVEIAGLSFKFTPATWTGALDGLGLGWLTVGEYLPALGSSDWRPTNVYREGAFSLAATPGTDAVYLSQINVELTSAVPTATVNFGNLCLGPGNGHTLGFWSNKNGAKAIVDKGIDVWTPLNALNLVDASGNAVTLSSHAALNSFLLGGTATNMANMLSVQMATMWLNANVGGVNGAGMVYGRLDGVADPSWLNALGYVSVNGLIQAANTSLGSDPLTLSGNGQRAYQERIKNLLDSLNNNNQLYVQARSNCALAF